MSNLSQIQSQKLLQKLSPQQIQMIKLLELPTLQLEQRIKKEIEENPALEEIIDSDNEDDTNINLEEYAKKEELPSYKLLTNNYSKDDKAKTIPLSNGCSIEEYLQEQITFKDVDNKIKKIALYIVGSLDGSGYLRREEQDIIDDILFITGTEVSTKDMKEAMSLVHSLEPHGVGARNLQEALTLQLKYHLKNTDVNTALQILENHFDLFVKKHYDKIMAKMGISEDLLKRALAIITNLSPKPANLYVSEGGQNEPTIQIVPDFILDNSRGYSELILNKYNTPEVKVSPGYLKMLEEIIKESKRASALERRGREGDMEAAAFIKQKIDSAKWFITA
ncbi:MAG: RNA polymerase sigma-54 factor, partial [Rikenellaceae bacterium]